MIMIRVKMILHMITTLEIIIIIMMIMMIKYDNNSNI